MKNRYNKIVAFVAILGLASCNDLFEESDIKKNPNAPDESQLTITPLTTGTLVGLGHLHEDTDNRIAFMWGGQLAGQSRQHAGFQNYTVAASTFAWNNYYNVLKNARLINKKAAVENNKLAIGVSQVIESMVMLKIASLYGAAPYSEALDDEKFPTPKYDSQVSLYNTLIALTNSAYDNLTSGVGSITGDFVYDGDEEKWAAAAKTLQARMYLHIKNYASAIASANLGISSSADDMLMKHGTSQAVDLNLNFDFFDIARPGDTSFDPPAYLPVFMCKNINTGISVTDVAVRNAKTDETGIYFHYFAYGAESAGGLDPNTADGMFVANAPHPFLTYYENQLILAEANARLASPNITAAIEALNEVRDGLSSGYVNGLSTGYTEIEKSGELTATIGSLAVIGNGTAFKTELQPGSVLLNGDGDVIGTVAAIADDEHLTLSSVSLVDVDGEEFSANGLVYLPYVTADFLPGGVANPLTGPNSGRNQQQALLYEIASQKFVILLAQYEVFNELRRLQAASPSISLGVPINNGTRLPARFVYPQNEINTNPNVPKINGSVADQFVKLEIFE
ncbi:MAG TPA: SusD/RagB family nutrient-binding outer membrane lipoprotein [Cyclobacteriaceae bacterium]|nr:SusD/RagB family nutrient-binding outer membrane lipoprotein [Cyclobacteriaceae bacterium]